MVFSETDNSCNESAASEAGYGANKVRKVSAQKN